MVTRKRKSLDDVLHDFQQFMYYRSQKSTAEGMFKRLGDKLKKHLDEHGTELTDDAGKPGNIVYKFSRPVYIGDKLKKHLDEHGTELTDDAGKPGNIVYKFSRPVYIGEKAYTGFEKRRTDPSEVFDEDAALKLAGEKHIPLKDVTTEVTLTMSAEMFEILEGWMQDSVSGLGSLANNPGIECHRDVDQNAFYRLHQKGILSEEEIDSLLVLPEGAEPSYKFWPMEASGEDLEDDE